eukprot:258319_1
MSTLLSKFAKYVCTSFRIANCKGVVSAKLGPLIDRKGTESGGVSVSVKYDFTKQIRSNSGSPESYQTKVEKTFSSKNMISLLKKLSLQYVERGTCSISDLKTSIEKYDLQLSFPKTLDNSHDATTPVECNKNRSFFLRKIISRIPPMNSKADSERHPRPCQTR